jgi:hypothetical protein
MGSAGSEAGSTPCDAEITRAISLDGEGWLIATDPTGAGRNEGWFRSPRAEAKPTRVPWIIQDAFPDYHGVAWYWRPLEVPRNERAQGRTLLRFWEVDYACQVWVNGTAVGEHEGGEEPFVLDVTAAAKPGAENLLALRVINPTHQSIDGFVLAETPHRNNALPYSPGSAWDQGGIIDSVELLLAPALWIEDIYARPDPATGRVRLEVAVRSHLTSEASAAIEAAIAPDRGGETACRAKLARAVPPGRSAIQAELEVPGHRLWELNDPFLYRVSVRLAAPSVPSADESSVRFGFRDFRFEAGAFRLNGRRIFLRCSHTGNCCPIGLEMPHDPDLLRRDLLNAKTFRFNAIRFIAGVAKRYQLDLCDEIGLMVYEESYASWCLADSPHMSRRYADSILGMVRRDRNHPSVTIWGLLNETGESPVFRRAVSLLEDVRALDDTRLVLLNSGRWDAQGGSTTGLEVWQDPDRVDPCVNRNGTDHVIKALGITWPPGQMAFHPGMKGDYAAVRWTAPAGGQIHVRATFQSIAEHATTDVHVLQGSKSLFAGAINVAGRGPECGFEGNIKVQKGDIIACVVGFGNGDYGGDTTALDFRLQEAGGKIHDARAEFSVAANPSGPWSYGRLASGPKPDLATFRPFALGMKLEGVGTLSNPGSLVWEDVLSDQHPYRRVPHTAGIINDLRTMGGGGLPLFISEYGIGSAVDLCRAMRHYESLGKAEADDARLYKSLLDRFLQDWERWQLWETFDRPEDFFAQSNARMGPQRLLGLNAIRSNPAVVGHSLTGTVDQGMTGEGLWTTFREFKPGTADALFDGWAPLRWCLFAEPVNVYRSSKVLLEAVLANEDALQAGEYPARLLVVGPGGTRAFEKDLIVRIPQIRRGAEPPFAEKLFSEEIAIDGPEGAYRFLATFQRGAPAAGGETTFHVYDAAAMPQVPQEVVLWGEDAELGKWLADRGIRWRAFEPGEPKAREAILAAAKPPAPGGAPAFRALLRHVARGSSVVFLSPAVFAKEGGPAAWLPLQTKGSIAGLPSWLYHKDEWAKAHPIFDGLPARGLLDYTVYREIIPDGAWVGLEPPAEAVAGGINAAIGYSSGLFVAVYPFGAGKLVLNALAVRENIGPSPVAERLLRNFLRFAARDAGAPLAEAPADIESRLDALGYKTD